MTTMTATSASAAAATTPAAAPANALSDLSGNFSSFLNLLMTQLQNQDPTAPMDTNTFTTQLVQFSSVEQQINTNTSLTQLIQATQGNAMLQSSGLVGKQVQATSDHLALQGGTAGVGFTLSSPQPVTVAVTTDAGTVLRSATVNATAGANAWTWDGKDNNGRTLPDGAYRVAVTGADSAGSGSTGAPQALPFTVAGTATGVQQGASGLQVQLGPVSVPLSQVQSVGAGP